MGRLRVLCVSDRTFMCCDHQPLYECESALRVGKHETVKYHSQVILECLVQS